MAVIKIGLFLFPTWVPTGNIRPHSGSCFNFSSKRAMQLELCNVVQTLSSEVLQEL